ncbi:MAG TPA: hypothetical protein VHP33_19845 [Polyangiaceae bacterium]|nr:hypothetical protein [Polyangiaceae bacterium]
MTEFRRRYGLVFVAGALAVACGGEQSEQRDQEGVAGSGVVGTAGNPAVGGGGVSSGGVSGAAGAVTAGGAAGSGVASLQGSLALLRNGSCALDSKSQIRCWGHENPFQVPSGVFTSLAADTTFACGRREAGTVACFPTPEGTQDLSYIPEGSYAAIDVGNGFCGIGLDGLVSSCGDSLYKPAAPAEAFSQVSMGRHFSCGIVKSDKSIRCWGGLQQAGASCEQAAVGLLDAPTGAFSQIASSELHSCAIRIDGTLACWGAGTLASDPPGWACPNATHFGQSLPPSGTFIAVAVGEKHGCAIRSDGTVACWGAGTTLGDCPANAAACGQSIPPTGQFAAVAVGLVHSCAMREDRSVVCWGFNGVGGRTTPPSDFP